MGKTVLSALVFDLWVGEGDPDFVHFIRTKTLIDPVDACSEKGDVVKTFFGCCFCTTPQSGTFDIYSDVVALRMTTSVLYGVFSLSTTQFEYDAMIISELFLGPIPFET
ncbi:MAG: Uncharacterised protein [Cryomorphaceae bacterium]|nr:MAG: Uncharacterised protein [Cryomorphaceae bacterium]